MARMALAAFAAIAAIPLASLLLELVRHARQRWEFRAQGLDGEPPALAAAFMEGIWSGLFLVPIAIPVVLLVLVPGYLILRRLRLARLWCWLAAGVPLALGLCLLESFDSFPAWLWLVEIAMLAFWVVARRLPAAPGRTA